MAEESAAGYACHYRRLPQPTDPPVWWAMSAVYNRSVDTRDLLSSLGVESFVPLRTVARVVQGRKERLTVPAVSNLIFVRANALRVQELKDSIRHLQFLCADHEGRRRRIVVPDEQMEQFRAVAGSLAADLVYYRPDEIGLQQGDRVRIHGGQFDGVEGTLVKVKGRRNRVVVVTIPTVVSVATLTFEPELLERLEPEHKRK